MVKRYWEKPEIIVVHPMESKKAIAVLMNMLNKYPLSTEEKEAILAAIGALDCANLAENRLKSIIKSKKAKRDKSLEW